MSWPVASFTLVAVVLLAGWLAYERSRPSARTVALVATLSALAALGRDAFAAVDEVKPITAMAFVIGYSLGPLPGFVVGAVGMLASNMLLGQGPYTPWQMAAWGIVGLLGAAAGTLSRRRLRRLPLAIGCALAAAVAKEIMNLYTWTLGAIHTPAAFLATAGTALPFDVVDVVSTLLFGLAFGPELVRLLRRAKARTTVRWEGEGVAGEQGAAGGRASVAGRVGVAGACLIALLASASVLAAKAHAASRVEAHAASSRQAISRALAYLVSAQRPDGGFGASPKSASTGMYTAWAAIGLAAAGRAPLSVHVAGRTVLGVLRAEAPSLSYAGDVERTMLALHACGVSAERLAGRNLLTQLLASRRPDGSFEDQVNITAFGILALGAAGRGPSDPTVAAAGRWLAHQQNGDGGFSFGMRGSQSDVDDTGAALQGLVAAGVARRAEVAKAVSYLRRAQSANGGFPQQVGGEANAQSTAWAVQGLAAAGRLRAFAGRRSPLAYLEGLQQRDGSVRYSSESTQTPVWVTSQVLAALAEKPLPIGRPRVTGRARPRSRSTKSETSSSTRSSVPTAPSTSTSSTTSLTTTTTQAASAVRSPAGSSMTSAAGVATGAKPATPGGTSAAAEGGVAARAAAGAERIASSCLEAISGLLWT